MPDHNTIAYLIQCGFLASFLDGTTTGWLLLCAVALGTAIPIRSMARRKGRSVFCWVGLALSIPVFPLLLLAWLPSLPKRKRTAVASA